MTETYAVVTATKSGSDADLYRKVAIIGSAGQLGVALRRSAPENIDVVSITRDQLDITDDAAVSDTPLLDGVDVIINTAAYTDVDGAESDPGSAHQVNALGPKYLAERAVAEGAFLIHVSTDYVFGSACARGEGLRPHDPAVPESIYGRTKLVGENNVLAVMDGAGNGAANGVGDGAGETKAAAAIVRTAWVWSGPTQPEASDFVSTMINLCRKTAPDGTIKVVTDQVGNPTFVGDLAAALWELAQRPTEGIFHVTGTGTATWNDVAREVFAAQGANPDRVLPCTSEEFPRPACRPAWSVLDGSAWTEAGMTPLPEWRNTLRRVLA